MPKQVVEENGITVTTYEPGELMDETPAEVYSQDVEKEAKNFLLGKNALSNKKKLRANLESKVIGRIGRQGSHLVDKLFELVDGIYMLDKNKGLNGRDIRYYRVPPNLEAIKYAIDRVLGKPTQHVEQSEEKSGIITVEHVIKKLADNPYGRIKETRPAAESAGETEEFGRT